ncbi:MAG: PAP/fibrillin family protein [Cyanobacteria bacterium J06642_2]
MTDVSPSVTESAPVGAVDRATAKTALLDAIARVPKPTGLPALSADIEASIADLEAYNPTPVTTAAAELLTGNWLTLYTSSDELLRLGSTLPGFKVGNMYQYIQADKGFVCNVAEINGLPYLGGLAVVRASFKAVSERRVKVTFHQAMIASQAITNYQVDSFIHLLECKPDQIPALKITFPENREQKGWLDITYLDETLRVGRGNEGSVFVLSKVPHSA